jgi:hypothetical protein
MLGSVVIDASAVIAVVTNEAHKPPVRSQASPLDVQGVDVGLSAEEIVSAVQETRAREGR